MGSGSTGVACVISIHAPREGSDPVAHGLHGCPRISIHAPREGSDDNLAFHNIMAIKFQSTLPARGATLGLSLWQKEEKISIHAPREGSDGDTTYMMMRGNDISIHAPREGSDRRTTPTRSWSTYFNPRSPRGERR